MASLTTNRLRYLLAMGAAASPDLDLTNDTIKVMLLGTGYTPNKDHNFISDLGANELSGTGYTAGFGGSGRKTLASKAIAQDDTNDIATFDAADVTWTGINAGTIAYIAVVKEVTSNSDSPVLAIIDVTDTATNSGDITAQWGANGLFSLSSP